MDTLLNIDWQSMFVPTSSIFEVMIRGSLMYLGMYFMLRIFRRQAGSVGIADLLVIVVIADAAQNGLAGESHSITEALILIATIILWDFFFDWIGFKSTFASNILEPKALLLIENGKILRKNLEKEFITEDELLSQLRLQGLEDTELVTKCYLESSGYFSVLTKSPTARKQKSN